MSTEIAPLLAQKELEIINRNRERIAKINQACVQLRTLDSNLDDIEIDLQFGAYLKHIKESITDDQIELLKNLQNTRVGFLTDRPSGGYDGNVLKNILIEALTIGVRLRGNEFCILGGNCYVTKYGLARLLDELIERKGYKVEGRENPAEITTSAQGNYNLIFKVIVKDSNENVILGPIEKKIIIKAKYFKGDKPYELGIDAVLGKAQRKIDNFIYSKLAKKKNLLPEADIDDVDLPSSTSQIQKGKISVSQILNKDTEQQGESDKTIEGEMI
jgi:hypothetical protein